MTRTWDTKKRILKLLAKKQMTMSEVSAELNLAPSTVSKHIDEMLRVGAIEQIDNPFIKKWKYYRANPAFSSDKLIHGIYVPRVLKQFSPTYPYR